MAQMSQMTYSEFSMYIIPIIFSAKQNTEKFIWNDLIVFLVGVFLFGGFSIFLIMEPRMWMNNKISFSPFVTRVHVFLSVILFFCFPVRESLSRKSYKDSLFLVDYWLSSIRMHIIYKKCIFFCKDASFFLSYWFWFISISPPTKQWNVFF